MDPVQAHNLPTISQLVGCFASNRWIFLCNLLLTREVGTNGFTMCLISSMQEYPNRISKIPKTKHWVFSSRICILCTGDLRQWGSHSHLTWSLIFWTLPRRTSQGKNFLRRKHEPASLWSKFADLRLILSLRNTSTLERERSLQESLGYLNSRSIMHNQNYSMCNVQTEEFEFCLVLLRSDLFW